MAFLVSNQFATSRLLAYSLFSLLLMLVVFWRLYFRFPYHELTEKDGSNSQAPGSHSEITFDSAMQDSYVVVGIFNMALCLVIVGITLFKHVFFGSLIGTEPQYLREKLTRFALFRLVFLVGVINATSWSSLLGWSLWFSCLGALHGFSSLARVRGEQLVVANNITTRQWVRFSIMLFLLFSGVALMLDTGIKCCLYLSDVTPETYLLGFSDSDEKAKLSLFKEAEDKVTSDFSEERSADFYQLLHVLLFMITDCFLVTLLLLQIVMTFAIHFIDRFELLGDRFGFNRTIWLYYINLFCDLGGIAFDLTNHLHMLIWSRGISLTSVIVILQLRVTYTELHQRIRRHSSYKQLVEFVRQQFPLEKLGKKVPESSKGEGDDEEQTPESCAICWEPLCAWRKLPCNHCFHETCLTRWMEQSLSCPTCRRVLNNNLPQQHQDDQRQRTPITTFHSIFRDLLNITMTDGTMEAATTGTQTGNPQTVSISAQATTDLQRAPRRPVNINQTILPLAMLPTVRAMAVRLRQHGGEGSPFVENAGPRLDLSIRVSVGAGMPVAQERRMRHIRPVTTNTANNTAATTPNAVLQQDGSTNRGVGSTTTNITTNTERQTVQRQVMQSTIQSRFFRFDGSRYFSWLPNISIELSEIFGELIATPDDDENQEGEQTTTQPQPTQSTTEEISSPLPTTQQIPPPPAIAEPTPVQNSLVSLFSRLFAAFLRGGDGVTDVRAHRNPRQLDTELHRQAREISAMFSSVPLDRILADLAVTRQAEATVENILSGYLQPTSESSPPTIPTYSTPSADVEQNDTELRQRGQTVQVAQEVHQMNIVAQPIRSSNPPPRFRTRRVSLPDTSVDLFASQPSSSLLSSTTAVAQRQSIPDFTSSRNPEYIQRTQRYEQMVIEGLRRFLARKRQMEATSTTHQRGPDSDDLQS